jgi:hypothetical protein
VTIEEKVRENRLRRAVARQGCKLVKIRRRDPQAIDYGKFLIKPQPGLKGHGLPMLRKMLDARKNPGPYSIDQVQAWVER